MTLALTRSLEAAYVGWILFVPCALLAVLVICGNWVKYIRYGILKRKPAESNRQSSSCLGGVLGAVALLIIPVPGLARWCWVPLMIDLHCFPSLLYAIYFWACVLRRNPFDTNPKGTAVCLECGGLSADWVPYCADCGHCLEDAMVLPGVRPGRQCFHSGKDHDNVVCLNCRASNLKSNQHCYSCGRSLENAPSAYSYKQQRSR